MNFELKFNLIHPIIAKMLSSLDHKVLQCFWHHLT
jgi:hypothetical protein